MGCGGWGRIEGGIGVGRVGVGRNSICKLNLEPVVLEGESELAIRLSVVGCEVFPPGALRLANLVWNKTSVTLTRLQIFAKSESARDSGDLASLSKSVMDKPLVMKKD